MLFFREACGILVYNVEKSELSICLAVEVMLMFCRVLTTCCELLIIQKQLTPVFFLHNTLVINN